MFTSTWPAIGNTDELRARKVVLEARVAEINQELDAIRLALETQPATVYTAKKEATDLCLRPLVL